MSFHFGRAAEIGTGTGKTATINLRSALKRNNFWPQNRFLGGELLSGFLRRTQFRMLHPAKLNYLNAPHMQIEYTFCVAINNSIILCLHKPSALIRRLEGVGKNSPQKPASIIQRFRNFCTLTHYSYKFTSLPPHQTPRFGDFHLSANPLRVKPEICNANSPWLTAYC